MCMWAYGGLAPKTNVFYPPTTADALHFLDVTFGLRTALGRKGVRDRSANEACVDANQRHNTRIQ